MTDELRDWEALRRDARIAVTAVLLGDVVTAEGLADAVLSVVDEETVRALCAEHIKNTMLRSMDFRNGASLELKPARDMIAYWVGAARVLLEGAENYSETTCEFGIPEDPQRYSFVVQKAGKLTPHEARRQAESERDKLAAENERLRARLRAAEGALERDAVGFVVCTWNQASGQPDLETGANLYDDIEFAETVRSQQEANTKKVGRGEVHRVCALVELGGEDA